MASRRAKIIRSLTGRYLKSIDSRHADVKEMRRRWHRFAGILGPARGVSVTEANINGLQAEWLAPGAAADGKLLLYLHGGAYIMGGCRTHRQFVSHIAKFAGVRALLPEYRLAPEHPFPAAIEDATGIYLSLLAQGYAAEDIIIAGDSAGGGLTMATLLSLRHTGDPLPAGACLISPWLDLSGSGESMTTHAQKDPWFRPKDLPVVTGYYCDESQLTNPLVSPVYANLAGMPPLYIQVGADEILLSDATRIADKVIAAGGVVDLEIWPDMWHVFQMFLHFMPESRQAVRKLGTHIRAALDIDESSET